MGNPREKYVHGHKNRHGKWVWYVRLPGRKKIRIKAEPNTPEFKAEYEAARFGTVVEPVKSKTAKGSEKWNCQKQ